MKKKPNIIVFMTDQQNAQTIDPGHVAKTPHMDRFRENAVVFRNTFTSAPHCCPARASFFTGLYPSQHGVWNNVEVDNGLSRGLYDEVKCFPETLQEGGYNTVFTGKWHVSAHEGPMDRGFNRVLNEFTSNSKRFTQVNRPRSSDWENFYSDPEQIKMTTEREFGEIARPGYPKYHQFGVDNDPFSDALSVDNACRELKSYEGEDPFFMYVGVTGPHDPYKAPQEFIDLYKDVELELPESFSDRMLDKPALYRRTKGCFALSEEEHLESLRHYLAFVSYEDYLFGKLLDTLQEEGLYEDTYILFVTDHGDYMGSHGLWAKGLPCFREAYNICAVLGGGDIKGRHNCDELVSICDFAPTFLDLAGLSQDEAVQGQSLLPLIKGEAIGNWRSEIFSQTNGNEIYGIQRAVWDKKWKLVFNTFDYDELYDLENDPHELVNVVDKSENNTVIKEYFKKLWTFAKETGDNVTCPYIMVALAPYGPGILLE